MDKKIIFLNGVFDLFHCGHLNLIYNAKKLGGLLYIGINSDDSTRQLKGPERPIIPLDQRFEILSSIKYVDRVFIFNEPTPIKLIKQIQPDIIVKGGDYKPHEVVGRELAKVVILPLLPNISSTRIIEKIKNS